MAQVKVKILKNVGKWIPGEVVEIDEEQAKKFCEPTMVNDGLKLVEVRKGMLLKDVQKLEEDLGKDMSRLSQHELQSIGKRNVVITPRDDAFSRKLEKMRAKNDSEVEGSDESYPRQRERKAK